MAAPAVTPPAAVVAPDPAATSAPAKQTARSRTLRADGRVVLKATSQRKGRSEAEEEEEEEREAAENRQRAQNGGFEREPHPDNPGEAIRFRLQSLKDENGYIPPDGLERAKAHVQSMRANMPVEPVAGINRTSWTWRGPGNIGGRTRAVAIHPTVPTTIFAGTVGGGIWKTTNAGGTWAPVDDFMANLAVTSIVFTPGNPAIMYAGTGEGFFNADQIRGNGIFKSIDGGTTWAQLASTNNANFNFVNRLAMSADGSIILAATDAGVYRSTDAGAIWNKVLTIPGRSTATDVKFLPGSNTAAVAAGYTGTPYFSTNGGVSFAPNLSVTSSSTALRVEFAVSASAPNNVYAMFDSSNGVLWKSTNGGANYVSVSNPAHLNSQGWYDNAIWVDPTNDNVVVIGGVDLWRSINGGVNFTRISSWQNAPSSAHADHHAIVSDPQYNGTTNRRVYFGNDGGVYKAENVLTVTNGAGGGFTSLLNNFGATQFYGASGHAGTGRINGGTQDNGTLLFTTAGGPQGWTAPFGGDGGFSAADPVDGNYFYGEYVFLAIHRNSSGGASSSSYIWGLNNVGTCKAAPFCLTDAFNGNANFIAPFILDPNNPNTLLAGGASLWRTNDVKTALTNTTGPSWAAIKTATGSNISAIAVAPGNSNVVYVGHNNGDIYRSLNGAAASPSWTKIDPVAMPNVAVQRLAVDPFNVNNVYAAFGSFGTTNFWRSIDGGANWGLSVGSGANSLPAAPIRAIALHPNSNGWIYVGTEVGIFASTDGGATWGLPHDGPANVSVDDLAFMGTTLIAGTHGRGIYTADTGGFATQISLDSPANGSTVTRPFSVSGWAINRSATSGTGVDAVHVYATPAGGGAATFLGVATYGGARGDIGALYGPQFTNCAFQLDAGAGLAAGVYTVTAYAHNAGTGAFDATANATVNVTVPPSVPFISVDYPAANSVVTSAFEVFGWALDLGASTGTGVDGVQFYIQPAGAPAPGVFVGTGSYGIVRNDVGGIFGARYNNSGFHFTVTGLGPLTGNLNVYAHSTVTGTYSIVKSVPITVNSNQLMSIDAPSPESTVTGPDFQVAGWAIDQATPTGTGVDALHIYAFPNPGSGEPAIFLGVATLGIMRSDVAGIYGARYANSGYALAVNTAASGLTPGIYTIVVIAHSTSGSFNNLAGVRVTIQ